MKLTFVDPGALNTHLKLEERIVSDDGQGGEQAVWSQLASVWAEVSPVGVKPQEIAGTEAAIVTHRVTLRARADVRRGMRFVVDGRALLVLAVSDPDESGRYLACLCEEMAP